MQVDPVFAQIFEALSALAAPSVSTEGPGKLLEQIVETMSSKHEDVEGLVKQIQATLPSFLEHFNEVLTVETSREERAQRQRARITMQQFIQSMQSAKPKRGKALLV